MAPIFLCASSDLRDPPAEADQQEPPVVKELRRLALERMADELKHPTGDEEHERRAPQTDREQCERDHDHWNPDGVAEAVHRILVARRISRDPLLGGAAAEHKWPPWCLMTVA